MTTTFYNFTPSTQENFQFQPTLDGQQYNAIVTWNFAAQRFYINLYALDGTLIFSIPVIGSDTGRNIQSASWSHGFATITTDGPLGYILGATIDVNVSGMVPDAYNGNVRAFVTRRDQIQYPLFISLDEDLPTQLGQVVYNVNMAGSYFSTSTLIYRPANRQFEVSP